MIYVVGDSTVSSFVETYFYQRYGWGTQLYRYLKEGVVVNNLALSGRSSLSFIKENNYQIFANSIKEGDFLFIGFGHNDEKDDDPNRYTNPFGDINDKSSFKYVLYNYYIKKCFDVHATPIIVTPVARLDEKNEYKGTSIHITKNGDYRSCLVDLAKELKIACVDLTSFSATFNKTIGFKEACLTHAITKGKLVNDTLIPDLLTTDLTHLNIYGASICAYYILSTLKYMNHKISSLLLDDISMPKKEETLVMDKEYKYVPYKEPDFSSYSAKEWYKTLDKNYCGIAFGDTGRGALDTSNGYVAKEENNSFIVGQKLGDTKITPLGKISLNSEGIALVGRKVSVKRNFIFEASAKVIFTTSDNTSGFGVSLRDDFYLNLNIPDKTITSNYVAAGLLNCADSCVVNFDRRNHLLEKSTNVLESKFKEEEAYFKIYRLGQVVEVTTTFRNKTYVNTFTDFDFTQIDKDNMYITMFATRSTIVKFTNVKFTDIGDAINA